MARKLFSVERVNSLFNDKYDFDGFVKLMIDAGNKVVANKTDEEANAKIREINFAVLGLNENAKRKEIRQAIRRNRIVVNEILEEVIPALLKSGWRDNPFFREYVEYKSMDDEDANLFHVEDDTILTVSKISGGHHDLVRQRLGEGEYFSIPTSWYGVKF